MDRRLRKPVPELLYCTARRDGSSKRNKNKQVSCELLDGKRAHKRRIIINQSTWDKRVGKNSNVKGNMYNPQKQNLTPSVSAGAS
jgi:hypothetical protein